MIDPRVEAYLQANGVRWCLIGAAALAAHGVVRETADVDLLTLDSRVLLSAFWGELTPASITRGDDLSDPLEGVVRFAGQVDLDLIVGRGQAMGFAVRTAQPGPRGALLATPLALVLLKLEAGSARDLLDVDSLLEAQRLLGQVDLPALAEEHLPLLSHGARDTWARLVALRAGR